MATALGNLRSLVAHGSAEAGSLSSTLTDLVNVMLRGEVPQCWICRYLPDKDI